MLIIFDLDDTLIDTTGYLTPLLLKKSLVAAVHEGFYLSDFGSTYRELCRFVEESSGTEEGIDLFFSSLGEKAFAPLVKKIVLEDPLEGIETIPLFPGVQKLLEKLEKEHVLALVTKGKEERQREKLEKTGLDLALFSKISVVEEGSKQVAYREIALALCFSPEEVVVCGDRIERDLFPAKELGYRAVHVVQGRAERDRSLSSHVDYSVASIEALADIFEKDVVL